VTTASPLVLIYEGYFVPHSLPVQLFLHAHGIAFRVVSDQDLQDFQFLPEHRLFIFPAGHCFQQRPEDAFGGLKGISRLKKAIADGMNYLGICAGAFAALKASWYPIDISFGLIRARHRWTGETGAGTQLLTIRPCEELQQVAGLGSDTLPIWYHNGPVFVRNQAADYRVLATFEPTEEERRLTIGGFLYGKHLYGTPAIIESSYGRGKVVACSPHPELGDIGIRDYQKRLRQWLEDNDLSDATGDPLATGSPGCTRFLQTLGGVWMQPVIASRSWRLLLSIVDGLCQV
jgi:glutamine amidotransferase-like uncharacterized protein